MRQIAVAEFRSSFGDLAEPVQVVRYGKVKGTWFPGENGPTETIVAMGSLAPAAMEAARTRVMELENEVARLKRQLAAAHQKDTLSKPAKPDDHDAMPSGAALDPAPWVTAAAAQDAAQQAERTRARAEDRRAREILGKTLHGKPPK